MLLEVKLDSRFDRMIASLKSFIPGFRARLTQNINEAGKIIEEEVQRSFDDQGPNWPPLDPDYLKWKEKVGWGSQKLIALNLLRSSLYFQRVGNSGGELRVHSKQYPAKPDLGGPKRGGASRRPTTQQTAHFHNDPQGRNPLRSFTDPAVHRIKPRITTLFSTVFGDLNVATRR